MISAGTVIILHDQASLPYARLMLVRNLDTETVCRVIGWPVTRLGRLVRGEFPPEPVWLRHLGDVLDLGPNDLAALAGVPAPPEGGRRSTVGGLIVDVITTSSSDRSGNL
jgi:hypothetical protein